MIRAVSVLVLSAQLVPPTAAQWSAPVNLTNLNSPTTDFYPSPTFDGLKLYFSSQRTGGADIYVATRAAPYAAFGAPVAVNELNDPAATDYGPTLRVDECEVFFWSGRAGGIGGSDLWRATRATPSLPFGTPVPVTELNSASQEWSPSLSADGLRLYFATDRAGGLGAQDIWVAVRPSWLAPFGAPVPVTELNSTAVDRDPRISPDGLTIFFASQRAGGTGTGSDLYMATRLSPTAPFANVVNVTALNSTTPDFTPGFNWFHDELFFCSQRAGGAGSNDLWSARYAGTLGVGFAGPTSVKTLRFADPGSPGLPYVAASALGSTPGIMLGNRLVPLNADPLLALTLGGLPPFLTGYAGLLNADGVAAGQVTFTGLPQAVGIRVVTAFLTLDAAAPFGIKTISDAHELLVQ